MTIDEKKFRILSNEIIGLLNHESNNCSADLGNAVGRMLGKHLDDKNFTIDGFLAGLEHGFSLSNGTHDTPKKQKKFKVQ